MAYATLMAHLQAGRENKAVLQVAGDLARRFGARIVGIAACQPIQIIYSDGGYGYAELIDADRRDIEKDIARAERSFREALDGFGAGLEWRSDVTYGPISEYLAAEARCADLVVTGIVAGAAIEAARCVNPGDLVMQAGRPVLVVPESGLPLKLDRALVAWKDTREARRAVLDALPLLKQAGHVAVVEIAAAGLLSEARAHVADVAAWLKWHGVAATTVAAVSDGDDAARLSDVAQEQAADFVVAGAYGHSRLREWALGGVTRDLLLRADGCAFLSH